MRPFVKWAGGKSQSISDIFKHIPQDFGSYFEPFVGGGALYFFLRPKKAFLSDSNWELMNTYTVVRDNVEELINSLTEMPNDKEFFESIRKQNPKELPNILAAARMIYLNKTCYNGLYRVNSKNEFNTPFASYANPMICDKATLRACSKVLANAELQATYFENSLDEVKDNDLVYFDPPYLQVKEDSFTSYTKTGFSLEDHERLFNKIEELSEKGVYCILSNSDVPWVREKYSTYEIFEIKSRRSINSKGNGRGKVSELLITNF